MRFPIRYQFMLPLLAVAVASLLAIAVINARLATRQTRARIEKQLHGVVSVLAESSYPLTDSVLQQMGGLAGADFVLTDAEGRVLASGMPLGVDRLAVDPLMTSSVEQVALGAELVVESRPCFHSAVWIERRPNLPGRSVLHILFSREDYDAAWRAAFLPPVLVGGVTIVALGLVVHVLAGRVSGVLSRLGAEVERLAEGDFSEVHPGAWDDETRDLAMAINRTAGRLVEYESELRQTERLRTVSMLGAGLAHEMRNAATGCRLAVDLHAEECHGDDADESLSVARRQLMIMEDRLRQLLQMGQGALGAGDREIDLAGLVSESVAMIRPAVAHAKVDFSWAEPEQPVVVSADPEMLGQAVMNLLLNALDAAVKNQASGAGAGSVSVRLRRDGGESELVVADSGAGPSEELAGDVFEPFVTGKAEGVGLGLAVAKRVVESCGGRIEWGRDTGLTKFTIRLPLAAAGVHHG